MFTLFTLLPCGSAAAFSELYPAVVSVSPLQRDTRHLAKTRPRKKTEDGPKQELTTTSPKTNKQTNKEEKRKQRSKTLGSKHNPQKAVDKEAGDEEGETAGNRKHKEE